jgi:hypothetical protein
MLSLYRARIRATRWHHLENHEAPMLAYSFKTRACFAPFATASLPLGLLGCAWLLWMRGYMPS